MITDDTTNTAASDLDPQAHVSAWQAIAAAEEGRRAWLERMREAEARRIAILARRDADAVEAHAARARVTVWRQMAASCEPPPPRFPRPSDPLWDAAAMLSGCVEHLAYGDGDPRERVRHTLRYFGWTERAKPWPQLAELPTELQARFRHVDEWIAADPSLRDLSDGEVDYVAIGIIRAYHTALRLHSTHLSATPDTVL